MSKIIGDIQKNCKEVIRASVNNYKGRDIFDLRVFYEDDQGEHKPTKKGIAFSVETFNKVFELMKKAKMQIINKN
ncbi:MAG: transcriptional coactivator p15/PC4 family protein [Candidatus Cloacimonetes bacterium]|nr:transcriptional coactivator p15/PC4 family protein [Candidatus Cloacimonadota bacterium]